MDRGTSRYTGAGRRPVDLTLGEDADVAGVGAVSANGLPVKMVPYRKLRSSSKGWVMPPAAITARLIAIPLSISCWKDSGPRVEADLGRLDEGVEGAAEGDIVTHRAEPRHPHLLVRQTVQTTAHS